jgi:glutathione synthase/RimK-type ligase-like ATP-grasp enzyme
MTTSCDVAILTDDRYEQGASPDWYVSQVLQEEALLGDALKALGLSVARISWSNPHVDWRQVRCAVFRSTWDYYTRIPQFSAWVASIARQTHLINAEALIRWNWDKHYLADLERSGIAIPATRFIEAGSRTTLTAEFARAGWSQAILKPAVSGGARHTYRLEGASVDAHETVFAQLLREHCLLLQEFLPSVLSDGEVSLIVIAGRCTHAVRKRAKGGDFRVQDDHGGTVAAHRPQPGEVVFAERAVAACPGSAAYARVDVVRDRMGALAVMEVELLEPELFFRFHPPAAQACALAIHSELSARQR